ncbi:hypothetical protein EB796_017629 [Bugula neritina]|uniref:CUB domain-containing protein n=1 Tax=Bugula neritina TaxID=10212 RepID=A0A7J7JDF6_BUGNE|nr:hypothetical protein EB796_017629 [Bugula neritina]
MTKNSQARGFKFQYQFVTDFGIKADEVVPYTPCTFWYKKSVKAEGEITSPNYPGIYPKGTLCQYLFDGDGSRVSIKFTDFDVIGYPPLCNEERDSDYVRLSNYRDTEDKMMDM